VHVFNQYTIRMPGASPVERDRVVDVLRHRFGIDSRVYYPVPAHRSRSMPPPAGDVDLPVTDRACREVLSLPVHPSLGERDLERIVIAVNSVARAGT
jgi:dTDP-4-amino-4,6-dideoxygalactose transaminase